jgi:hypothetical protein
MAVIYSYPKATPTASDLLIGTLTSDASGENPTKTFSISDIIGLVPAAGTGGTVTSIGLTNTDNFLTISNSPITTSGNISIDLTNNGGTPSTNTFYRGDGQWAVPPNTVPYTYTLTSVANAPNIDINLTDNFSNVTFVKLINGAGINMTSVNNEITVANTGVNSIVGSTFINIDSSTATAPIVSLANNSTTPSNTKFYRGDGTWQTIAAGGTMSSWNLAGDSGTAEQVDDGQTVTIAGGTGVNTVVSASDTVTVNLDSAVPTSIVAGSNVQVSGTGAVTIAAANSVQNSPNPVGSPTVTQITNIVALTQAQYNALTPVDTHLYIITA